MRVSGSGVAIKILFDCESVEYVVCEYLSPQSYSKSLNKRLRTNNYENVLTFTNNDGNEINRYRGAPHNETFPMSLDRFTNYPNLNKTVL